eukprot:1160446-Pelagomonas_calceolata.AAC.1
MPKYSVPRTLDPKNFDAKGALIPDDSSLLTGKAAWSYLGSLSRCTHMNGGHILEGEKTSQVGLAVSDAQDSQGNTYAKGNEPAHTNQMCRQVCVKALKEATLRSHEVESIGGTKGEKAQKHLSTSKQ